MIIIHGASSYAHLCRRAISRPPKEYWVPYRSMHHSGDMKRFPAIFLKFLCTLLPWLAELSAESAQQQTLMSRLLLHDSLG